MRSTIGNDILLAEQQREQLSRTPETAVRSMVTGQGATITYEVVNDDYSRLSSDLEATEKRIADGKARMTEILGELSSMEAQLSSAAGETVTEVADSAGNAVGKVADDVAALEQSIQRAVEVNRALGSERSDEDVVIDEMRSGVTSLIQKYGAEEEVVRKLIDKYWELTAARARSNAGESLPELAPVTGRAEVQSPSGLAGNRGDGQEPVVDVDQYVQAQTAVEGLAGAMRSLSGVVGEGAAQWLQWMANMLSAVGAAVPQLKALSEANRESASTGAASAASNAGASVASTPFVGAVMAVAAIASVVAALATIPKFAAGGIAYGPTLGLFGEYPGAARNPEVVAPLDRLRSMLRSPEDSFGHVEFEIRGDRLVGVLNRYGSKMRRS